MTVHALHVDHPVRTALDLDKGSHWEQHTKSDEELPANSQDGFSLGSDRFDGQPPGDGSQLVIHVAIFITANIAACIRAKLAALLPGTSSKGSPRARRRERRLPKRRNCVLKVKVLHT